MLTLCLVAFLFGLGFSSARDLIKLSMTSMGSPGQQYVMANNIIRKKPNNVKIAKIIE